jgi:hypothetical protein
MNILVAAPIFYVRPREGETFHLNFGVRSRKKKKPLCAHRPGP